jgi:hypothetical protein
MDAKGSEESLSGLVEFALVIFKWKHVAVGVFVLVVLSALLLALVFPAHYSFTTTIEVSRVFDNGVKELEPIETVQAKLTNSYIPLALEQIQRDDSSSDIPINLTATVPRKSKLVVLSSSGPLEHAPVHLEAHQIALDNLVADHHRTVTMVRAELERMLGQEQIRLSYLADPSTLGAKQKELESRLREAEIRLAEVSDPDFLAANVKLAENRVKKAEIELASLKDDEILHSTRLERLEARGELIRAEIEGLREEIAGALKRRETASDNTTDATSAMTLLMIDNEIQQNRTLLAITRNCRLLRSTRSRRNRRTSPSSWPE